MKEFNINEFDKSDILTDITINKDIEYIEFDIKDKTIKVLCDYKSGYGLMIYPDNRIFDIIKLTGDIKKAYDNNKNRTDENSLIFHIKQFEKKQVKEILKNMKHYALKNACEFTETKYKASDLLDNQPKDLLNYFFYESGLILNFNVSFKEHIIYIEEYSEDVDIKQQTTFKEFIKFQEYFLNSGVKTTNSLSLKPIHIKRCKKLIALNNLIRTEDATLDNITLSFMDVKNDDMYHYSFNIGNDDNYIKIVLDDGKFFLYDIKKENIIVGGLKWIKKNKYI